ncbi:MAG TPA: UDP-N-acetylglucosamine 2-epimerase (non-hydrolyzing) [Cyclobacteriaceae bacterium]|nr:UDP-N-acetylglucosamine 2-epimerase (non-hydrolyzing) [Cyclobacteriaceae bacterium]
MGLVKRIAIVVGTRPEAIKLIPVYKALLADPRFEVVLISTGQHHEMLQQIFSIFNVTPDVELFLMKQDQTLAEITSLLFGNLDRVFSSQLFDIVVVQGDTTTAMVAAMTAFYRSIKVAHVEAGLRSFDMKSPFPEEMNRRIISLLASVHFAPTKTALKSLESEGIDNVFNVGNTVVDCLINTMAKVRMEEGKYYEKFRMYFTSSDKLVLVTTHRRESFGEGIQNICLAIQKLAFDYPAIKFIIPVHLNRNVRDTIYSLLLKISNICLIDPQPYDNMVFLMSKSYIILTDSGGIQEEAPSLNVPLIVMRSVTERPEGIDAGCSVLSGTTSEGIISAFNSIVKDDSVDSRMRNTANPYGDGRASERIAQILYDFLK